MSPRPRIVKKDQRPSPKGSTPESIMRDVHLLYTMVVVPPGWTSERNASLVCDLETLECFHTLRSMPWNFPNARWLSQLILASATHREPTPREWHLPKLCSVSRMSLDSLSPLGFANRILRVLSSSMGEGKWPHTSSCSGFCGFWIFNASCIVSWIPLDPLDPLGGWTVEFDTGVVVDYPLVPLVGWTMEFVADSVGDCPLVLLLGWNVEFVTCPFVDSGSREDASLGKIWGRVSVWDAFLPFILCLWPWVAVEREVEGDANLHWNK